MNYCVPEDKEDMYFYHKITDEYCIYSFGDEYKVFPDGLCRKNTAIDPNQIVCLPNQVLYANSSCKDNYDE